MGWWRGQRLSSQCAKIKPFLSGVVSIGMWKSLVRSVLPVFQPDLLDLTLEHEDVKVCGEGQMMVKMASCGQRFTPQYGVHFVRCMYYLAKLYICSSVQLESQRLDSQ